MNDPTSPQPPNPAVEPGPKQVPDRPLTLRELIQHIAPLIWRPEEKRPALPDWPPDLFAVVATILDKSGAYTRVVTEWPPRYEFDPEDTPITSEAERELIEEDWTEWISFLGTLWRDRWPKDPPPKVVSQWWSILLDHADTPINQVQDQRELCQALLQLSAVADEACYGVGTDFVIEPPGSVKDDLLWVEAEELLARIRQKDASLCMRIDPSRVRVLPKSRTPAFGMTLRSTSLYLALCRGGEAAIRWHNVCGWKAEVEKYLNLLLIPWPEHVLPSSFRELTLNGDAPYKPEYLMFGFDPAHGDLGAEVPIQQLIDAAKNLVGKIDGIVLPESSVNPDQIEKIWEVASRENCLMIAGLRSKERFGFCGNSVETRVPIVRQSVTRVDYKQAKHHRWQLSRSQIVTYGLGSQLHPDETWWEGIELARRELNLLAIQPWLTACVLICEDLARQEPMADIIRSVGPSLVVALLMDGPQLKTRWPSRYATVLADDPGTSVLTLSSIGMVKLSRPPDSTIKPSRIVALWKDSTSPAAVEIELPERASGIVLSLVNQSRREVAADGRIDDEDATTLVLGGIHPIFLEDREPARRSGT